MTFVHVFKLDITTTLVNLYSGNGFAVSGPGKFVTALVIAGGSSGVNNLFLALGFRSVKRTQQVTPKPRRTEGWVAVRLIRDAAIGPVMVLVSEVGGNSTIAGTITGTSKPPGFLRYFLRDPGRFPTAGGHSLDVNKQYEIQLTGEDNSGQPVTSSKWGPYQFSAGAIVDIDLTL